MIVVNSSSGVTGVGVTRKLMGVALIFFEKKSDDLYCLPSVLSKFSHKNKFRSGVTLGMVSPGAVRSPAPPLVTPLVAHECDRQMDGRTDGV